MIYYSDSTQHADQIHAERYSILETSGAPVINSPFHTLHHGANAIHHEGVTIHHLTEALRSLGVCVNGTNNAESSPTDNRQGNGPHIFVEQPLKHWYVLYPHAHILEQLFQYTCYDVNAQARRCGMARPRWQSHMASVEEVMDFWLFYFISQTILDVTPLEAASRLIRASLNDSCHTEPSDRIILRCNTQPVTSIGPWKSTSVTLSIESHLCEANNRFVRAPILHVEPCGSRGSHVIGALKLEYKPIITER